MFQTEPNMLFPATTPPPLNRLFPPLEELNKQKVVTQKVENASDVGVSLNAQSVGLSLTRQGLLPPPDHCTH